MARSDTQASVTGAMAPSTRTTSAPAWTNRRPQNPAANPPNSNTLVMRTSSN